MNRARDLLFLPGTASLWRRRLEGRVMALVYHRVSDPGNNSFLARGGVPVISPANLSRELSFLQSLNAEFLTPSDLRDGRFPQRRRFGVIVTFDDGFKDNYSQALAVLNELGIEATFFQCAGMIDSRELLAEHALYCITEHERAAPALIRLAEQLDWPREGSLGLESLMRHAGLWIRTVPSKALHDALDHIRASHDIDACAAAIYPSRDDLRRALESGHEIGSHGMNHLPRTTLDDAGFERELSTSRDRIQELVGLRPKCFSYPFNGYHNGDGRICGAYYDQAMTVDGRLIARGCDPLSLPRFTWPGPAKNGLRFRRWLLTGSI